MTPEEDSPSRVCEVCNGHRVCHGAVCDRCDGTGRVEITEEKPFDLKEFFANLHDEINRDNA